MSKKAATGRLTFEERISVYNFLKTNLTVTPDGYADYLGTWDDKKVGKRFNVSYHGVAYLRQKKFGVLKPAKGLRKTAPKAKAKPVVGDTPAVNALAIRLDNIEKRLAFLEKELGVTVQPSLFSVAKQP